MIKENLPILVNSTLNIEKKKNIQILVWIYGTLDNSWSIKLLL